MNILDRLAKLKTADLNGANELKSEIKLSDIVSSGLWLYFTWNYV